ncbi:MAG: HAMP domain-containing histidine kinase, partial [Oscillospiraceae bacterium]|nr:HAMP domain-containing histidine kinase [Oscillospiraceae bacterium]
LWELDHLLGLGAMILIWTAFVLLFCLIAYNLYILEKGGRQMANVNLEDKIPEEKLFWRFQKHAEALNSMSTGMNKAVNDRLKSEMFRTELIANVSHDIRTPLTSIINYTDLLSKLDLDNAQAQEYIATLGRQSARLRKLTEDVLEASKATTGNIKVEKQTMDLRVLLEQTEGEFIERLEEKHLTLVKDMIDTPQYISVDGRLLWRVLDNLFGNICKYAMEGTRVYMNVLKMNNEVICMLRNISATQLNVSADTLMERFVQGDRSRNAEGSGLGLSIAQSLTTLQGGQLDLQIDGDLFKVILRFPCAPPPELPTEMTP